MSMILRFFQFFSPYLRSCLLLAVILLMTSGITVITPFLYQELVDKGIFKHNIKFVIVSVILIAAALVIQELLSLGQTAITLHMREGVFSALKQKVYRHIMGLPQSYFSEQHKGRLLSRITSDVNVLQHLFLDRLVYFLRNVLVAGCIFCIILKIQWKMVVLSLIFIPLLYVLFHLFRKKISALSRLNQEQQESLMERLQEDLAAVKAMQSFSVIDERAGQTARLLTAAEALRRKLDMQYAVASSSTIVINVIGLIVIWGMGAIEVMEQHMTIGKLIAISFFLNYMINLFYSSYYSAMQLQGSIPSAKRIFEVLDVKQDMTNGDAALERKICCSVIAMDNVTFSYSLDKPILKQVTTEFREGEFVGIIGRSGQGKTTLANLFQRFADPQEGSIKLDGVDIRDMKLDALRRMVAVIPQEDLLMNESVRDNIIFYRDGITEVQFQKACEQSQVSQFAEQLADGYDTIIGERGARLSGGQRKRIAIARALLEDPCVLILDEATAMLDEETEQAILETIAAHFRNKIILMITHKTSNLTFAHRIIRIKEGRLEQETMSKSAKGPELL